MRKAISLLATWLHRRAGAVLHDTLGEMVIACIVPESGTALDERAVRAFVAGRLSSYKVPRGIFFLAESELSLTGSNKLKTAALREPAARRLPIS
jgi:fatty-acyl-CoA synthase